MALHHIQNLVFSSMWALTLKYCAFPLIKGHGLFVVLECGLWLVPYIWFFENFSFAISWWTISRKLNVVGFCRVQHKMLFSKRKLPHVISIMMKTCSIQREKITSCTQSVEWDNTLQYLTFTSFDRFIKLYCLFRNRPPKSTCLEWILFFSISDDKMKFSSL